MTTSRTLRILSLLGFFALAASSHATALLGCKIASITNVDCSSLFGAIVTDEGESFYTSTDHYVGYHGGMNESSVFMGTTLTVTNYDVFATSVDDLATADQGSGATMVVEFEAETLLTGLVLSGLGDRAPLMLATQVGLPNIEAAQVVAYNALGEKVFDQIIESRSEYAYVNFGDIVSRISTLLISSGGGLPGLTASNNSVAYFITPLPEPASMLLILTGLGFMGLRRRNG